MSHGKATGLFVSDSERDQYRISHDFHRAKDFGVSVAKYVAMRINTTERRCMANTGTPLSQMTAAVY